MNWIILLKGKVIILVIYVTEFGKDTTHIRHVQEVIELECGNDFREGYQQSGPIQHRELMKQMPENWGIFASSSAVASASCIEGIMVLGGLSDLLNT